MSAGIRRWFYLGSGAGIASLGWEGRYHPATLAIAIVVWVLVLALYIADPNAS